MKLIPTRMSDQVRNVNGSISEPAIAALLHQSMEESECIAGTGGATELSEDLVNETPTEEGDLPLQLPRRVDTEAGVRLVSSAFAPQQVRPELERRATFPDSPINLSSRVNSTTNTCEQGGHNTPRT